MFREGATAYDVLGVSKRSSQQDIKRVFRRLAVRLHPDKLGPFESDEAAVKANDRFVKVRVISVSYVPGTYSYTHACFRCSTTRTLP